MKLVYFAVLLLEVSWCWAEEYRRDDTEFPDDLDLEDVGPVEYCFKTVARLVGDRRDTNERQITRRCCEGWYTPEGKVLCSARHDLSVPQEQDDCAKCSEEVRDLRQRVESLEKLLKSHPVDISGLEKKVETLQQFNRNHTERISIMEVQILNLTIEMSHVVAQQQGAVEERSATLPNDPCDGLTCPAYPGAMCMVSSRCGRDVAVFVDENFHTVNCNLEGSCDLLPPTYCTTDPCQGLTCNGFPEAFCVVADCDCTPTFMLPDGSKPLCLHDDSSDELSTQQATHIESI